MALWVCGGEAGCGTKYAVGLFRCPRCHNDEFFEDGDPMAKITRHGGASDKTLPVPEPETEAVVPAPDTGMGEGPGTGEPMQAVDGDEVAGDGSGRALPPIEDEGGEESSPGSSSSASTEKPQPTSEPSSKPSQRRARKTASRSAKDQTENPSAPSTDGGQTEATSAADETAD